MKLSKKLVFNTIKIVVVLYCGIGIAIYYTQDKWLLHPVKIPADKVFKFSHSFQEINIPINKTDTMNLIRCMPMNDTVAKGAVIYFHGNAGNVETEEKYIAIFLAQHYEVWMPDYPGFGKSTGEISEKKLHEQAYQVKRMVNNYFPDEKIILYGKSFGAGIAANLATSSNVKKLVLEAPYYSIPDLFSSYLPIYPMQSMIHFKLPVGAYLDDVQCPVAIFDGTTEKAISRKDALRFEKHLKDQDQLIFLQNGKQNENRNSSLYQSSITTLLQ